MLPTSDDPLVYYASQSFITNPGKHAPLLDALPTDLDALTGAINAILVHNWIIRRDSIDVPDERRHEFELHGVGRMLAGILKLDPRPLNEPRPVERRLIVDCRHFATLFCAVLRQRGIPARVRCGFASYLEPDFCMDHWVCEYWHAGEGRWVLEDPDVGKHDVSREEFTTGGMAWLMARSGEANPQQFGYAADTRGWWTLRADLIRDFAALNKVEVLSADSWGELMKPEPDESFGDKDWGLFDPIAALIADNHTRFAELRTAYEQRDDLRVPPVILRYNYTIDFWRNADLQAETVLED